MKRVFGIFEAVFDVLYLCIAFVLGLVLLLTSSSNEPRMIAGIMSLVLSCGDAFHLVPRICVILKGNEEFFRASLGRGKQITSITMTIFYLLLWQIGKFYLPLSVTNTWTYIIYSLAAIRIILCLFPQNKWKERYAPLDWSIWRNIPFFILGFVIAIFFFIYRNEISGLYWSYLAIILSFAFYLPVVLWSNQNPKIGMLMLPKTCAYVWILIMCLSL